MSKVEYINTDSFASEVETNEGTVIVDFTATWCPPCKMLAPVLDRVADKYTGQAKFVKVDIDENTEVAAKIRRAADPEFAVLQKRRSRRSEHRLHRRRRVVEQSRRRSGQVNLGRTQKSHGNRRGFFCRSISAPRVRSA